MCKDSVNHLCVCDRGPYVGPEAGLVAVSPGTLMQQEAPLESFPTPPPAAGQHKHFLSHIRFSQMFRLCPEAHFCLPPENRSSSRLADALRHHAGECQTAARRNMMLGVKHVFSFSAALSVLPSLPSVSLQVLEMFSISFPSHFCHLLFLFSPFFPMAGSPPTPICRFSQSGTLEADDTDRENSA